MNQPILHHYPNSPFSEKVRLIFGFKGIHWGSVVIPPIMPKPDVLALTGGYRKTPILQIGSDIYCDSALIAEVLEELQGEPTLYPAPVSGQARLLAQWADSTLFWTAVPYALQPAGIGHVLKDMTPADLEAFRVDRSAFRANLPRMRPLECHVGMKYYMRQLESILGDGRDWLCGAVPSIADFSFYHCLWFIGRAGPLASMIEDSAPVSAWYRRVRDIGHGDSDELDSGHAVELAAQSPASRSYGAAVDISGFALGDEVTVTPVDYGCDPSPGILIEAQAQRLTIERHDPRAGTVRVHFPRIGFELRKPK